MQFIADNRNIGMFGTLARLACSPKPPACVYTGAMTMAPPPTEHRSRRSHSLFVLLAAALLHLLALGWLGGLLRFPAMHAPENTAVITATLTAPPPKPVIKAAPKPVRHTPRPPRPRLSPPPEISPALAASETARADFPDSENGDDIATSTATEMPAADTEPNSVHYNIDLPPSADLKYDVQKTPTEGAPMYGSGTISWHTDGSKYSVNGDFGVLFITALRFQSTGTIEDTGIVPELYSEKRFRKAETNTHFHRERNTISFSSSTLSYPRSGGEQDRASIIWQLAGIGRGDSGKFVPGASIDLFVAGTRNAETWQILVLGLEEITIDGISTQAWHLARAPRSGSHDQKLDIWLAPEQNWYPVRLRYTESNGDYLDMTLTSLNVSAVH
ncbi:DUF3108 domain-containing protein [Herminiimonas sp. NPDC097707]|uniref:DUF3108 domain-containing protein n=1 Tax=Herminiimonas sp. NPDC097707 TaxID=3364007 RepID=UPI003839EDD7